MNSITEKCCTKCREWKSKSEFNKDKNRKDGLSLWCRTCSKASTNKHAIKNREYYKKKASEWYYANQEKSKARKIARYKANPDKILAYQKTYQKNHPEVGAKSSKKWNEKNIDIVRLAKRIWKKLNPDKVNMHRENRRAHINGNGGIIAAQDWIGLKIKHDYTCLCCKRREPEIKLTLDHVIPLSLGGKNIIENAQPLCQSCNSRKHVKEIDYR